MRTEFLEDESVAVIYLGDGENRLNPEFFSQLNEALDLVERNDRVQMVITTGEGKFYSNGLDLKWMNENPSHVTPFYYQIRRTFKRILTFPVVTLAAINGHAFAGGAMFSMCHDLRVMKTERGWMCLNEVFLEMGLPQWMVEIVRGKIPSGPVEQFLFVFGKRFTAAEAFKERLVNQVSPGEHLLSKTVQLGREIIGTQGFDRKSLSNIKSDVYQKVIKELDGYTSEEAAALSRL